MRVLAVVALLLAVPAASAGYASTLYFLEPTDDPTRGTMSAEQPGDGEPASAAVASLPADAPSATFVALEGPNATHVLGRVLVGMWADLAAAQGSVEARFVLVQDGTVTEVARAVQPVSMDPDDVPEPTGLLPPDPADPQGAVFHAAMQVLPLVARPPVLLDLGLMDLEVPEGAVAGVELRLVEDNATSTPAAGVARVAYGATTAPSFVYVPWWSEDPPGDQDDEPASAPDDGGDAAPPDDMDREQELPPEEDSPGVGLLLVTLAFAGAAWLRRRR